MTNNAVANEVVAYQRGADGRHSDTFGFAFTQDGHLVTTEKIRRDARPGGSASYRGGPEKARTDDGSGPGLTICRAIVEAHGGKIWFPESALGARVRFSVRRRASRLAG